ncbi:L,D-transpeptidase family protein [Arcanobacterium ihumii]|uniref:L,D-transpeptidase family protein n=1 Tax=Arcanobacterium ihumii TaxID=2138162 RepID=UPI000F5301DA|nr:L,D-transpeptidase family protein [Arcanobacterium ihumii]
MSKKRIAIWSAIGIVAVAIVALGVYIAYFALGQRALPGTKVGDVSVAGMTSEEIQSQLDYAVKNESLHLTGADIHPQKATLAQLGMTVDSKVTADAAVAGKSSWTKYFTALFRTTTVEPTIHTNESTLTKFAQSLTEGKENAKSPVEPSIVAAGDHFEIKAGMPGRSVKTQDLIDAGTLLAHTQQGFQVSLKLAELSPKTTEESLKPILADAQALAGLDVAVNTGKNVVSAPAEVKVQWIDLTSGKPVINADAVRAWVAQTAEPVTNDSVTGQRLLNTRGEVTIVRRQATAATTVSNLDAVVNSIVENMGNKTATNETFQIATAELKWDDKIVDASGTPLAYTPTGNEKWIDVNLSNHTMTAYEGTTVVRGPIPVVNGASETPTVIGTFAIDRKYPSKTMRGENTDGSKYETPDVQWVMFFKGPYAIHAAYWRSRFGFADSHGCVNTPTTHAKWLYDWAPMGTVVVTHR